MLSTFTMATPPRRVGWKAERDPGGPGWGGDDAPRPGPGSAWREGSAALVELPFPRRPEPELLRRPGEALVEVPRLRRAGRRRQPPDAARTSNLPRGGPPAGGGFARPDQIPPIPTTHRPGRPGRPSRAACGRRCHLGRGGGGPALVRRGGPRSGRISVASGTWPRPPSAMPGSAGHAGSSCPPRTGGRSPPAASSSPGSMGIGSPW